MLHKWERMDFACLGQACGIIFRAGSRSRDKTPYRLAGRGRATSQILCVCTLQAIWKVCVLVFLAWRARCVFLGHANSDFSLFFFFFFRDFLKFTLGVPVVLGRRRSWASQRRLESSEIVSQKALFSYFISWKRSKGSATANAVFKFAHFVVASARSDRCPCCANLLFGRLPIGNQHDSLTGSCSDLYSNNVAHGEGDPTSPNEAPTGLSLGGSTADILDIQQT